MLHFNSPKHEPTCQELTPIFFLTKIWGSWRHVIASISISVLVSEWGALLYWEPISSMPHIHTTYKTLKRQRDTSLIQCMWCKTLKMILDSQLCPVYMYSTAWNHCNIRRGIPAVVGCGFAADWMRHDRKRHAPWMRQRRTLICRGQQWTRSYFKRLLFLLFCVKQFSRVQMLQWFQAVLSGTCMLQFFLTKQRISWPRCYSLYGYDIWVQNNSDNEFLSM